MNTKTDKVDIKLVTAKLEMWNKKLADLKVRLDEIMVRRSEAMAMGDLRENAAFQMADEDASAMTVQIDEVKRIIAKLEAELEGAKK